MVGPDPATVATAPARAPIRLAIWDDQEVFRAGIRAVLGPSHAFQLVGEIADGGAVLSGVHRMRPDVLLLDIQTAGLDGLEATRQLVHARRKVKVLVLTARLDGHTVAEYLDAGASGYILKSVPAAELAGAIRTVAAGGRYLSPAALARLVDDREVAAKPAESSYDRLTDREREVLKLLADGLSVKEVAARLDRSVKTAEVHTYNLMHKLGVHRRTGLVKYAIAHGLLKIPLLDVGGEPGRSKSDS